MPARTGKDYIDSLKKMKSKALLFVAEKLAVPQDEIFSKEFARHLPEKSVEVVPGSVHMTFLQSCKPDFPVDDRELKELCADTESKLRIQKNIAEKSRAFFLKSWRKT